jgi:hypothetical protein
VTWLNPLAWLGLLVLIAPILIHILVQRHAERFSFPTLRFIQPMRLAAIRRHVLDDLPLLIARAAILAVAVGALAGPVLMTSARRQSWNARIVRATVTDRGAAGVDQAGRDGPPGAVLLARTFETSDLRDGVRRATAWLESAPPARRELVVSAPLTMGSIAQADLGAIPRDVGIRFERSGTLPASRSFAGTPVLAADLQRYRGAELHERTIELSGPSTSVRDSPGTQSRAPIDIVAPPEGRKAAEAALTAVLSQRVHAPVPGRTARVVFEQPAQLNRAAEMPAAPTEPWIADAIAQIRTADDLQAVNTDGTVAITATSDGPVLVVRTSQSATSTATLRLLRTVLNALAQPSQSSAEASALPGAPSEILPIADARLRAWERPSGEVRAPRLDTLDHDDRRWWWAAALLLLAVEAWVRRARRAQGDGADAMSQEAARVA